MIALARAHRSLPSRLVALMVAAAGLSVAAALVAAARLPEGAVAAALNRFNVEGLPAVPTAVLTGAAVAMVSQLARVRVRAGGGLARLAWGEAAIVVLLANFPPQVVPLVALLGFAAAHAALHLFDARASRARPVRESIYGVAALTVGAALATVVMVVIWGSGTAGESLPARFVAALCAAAAVYFVATFALVILRIVAAGGDLRDTVSTMVTSSPLMLVGNVAVGLVVVWACATSGFLLLLLPPVLWLMHQFYANRIGEDDERRTWAEFADVARDLNRLDERDAATAGIAGAVRLFRVPAAKIVLSGGRSHGDLPPGPYTSRALTVGSVSVGELQLAGPPPQRSRDRLMLATFGDALAAALHDAITHDELRAMSERTTYDAVRDPLTGLFNRAALLARGNGRLSARSPGAPVALLLLDVNDFKEVNNALGHTAGDEVLKVIARRVQGTAAEVPASDRPSGPVIPRPRTPSAPAFARSAPGGASYSPGAPAAADVHPSTDLHARLGGDEFAILITDLADGAEDLALAAAVERARRLGAQIAAPMEIDGVVLSKETSIGVVVAAAGSADLTELLRRADIAMYQAKHGGQPVAWYDPARDDASTDRLALLAELREALNAATTGEEQLTLDLQPAIALTPALVSPKSTSGGAKPAAAPPAAGTAPVTGVEALIRWRHPRRGRLMPGQFLPAVEASELIGPLTHWVLEKAIFLAAGWRRAGSAVPVAVNISARSLADRQLPETIKDLLSRYRLPAELLVLEITETVMLSNSPVIDDVLARVRRLGVQLAVDDFGTGYSAFTLLTRVPVQEVKIDREFVAQMLDSPKAGAIVQTTVDLGRRIGLRVVAEGVENPEQRARLAELGCTAAQGFLFYPPMSPESLQSVLRERRQVQRRHLRAEGTG
ncbi:putative bifunctional diguanylate cyclase/phosphodiesterase [Dactylosporangium sp. CA-139114]|uniref:putative bifunctional diguanylate cyclase/phosphodiesterase n=1 Tax=Dactylosporangium sp. CA-139114 TaxID=3239931 RepID=UPI003D999A8A